jgi:hypothetical protein
MVRAAMPATEGLGRKRAALRAIIDMEKPAHTYYDLLIANPTMQIGVTSAVGKNTVLGIL